MNLTLDFELNIDPSLMDREEIIFPEKGSYSVMVNTPVIERYLRIRYDVSGLALKVFNGRGNYKIKATDSEWPWGAVPLERAIIIQNLFAVDHLAPRVYGIASINGFVSQVVEYVDQTLPYSDRQHAVRMKAFEDIMNKYDIITIKDGDYGGWWNWRGNKLVDFSHFNFRIPASEPITPREPTHGSF